MTEIKSRIRVKRCNNESIVLNSFNILPAGAPLYNTDTGELYIGDGESNLSALSKSKFTKNGLDVVIETQEQFDNLMSGSPNYVLKPNSVLLRGTFVHTGALKIPDYIKFICGIGKTGNKGGIVIYVNNTMSGDVSLITGTDELEICNIRFSCSLKNLKEEPANFNSVIFINNIKSLINCEVGYLTEEVIGTKADTVIGVEKCNAIIGCTLNNNKCGENCNIIAESSGTNLSSTSAKTVTGCLNGNTPIPVPSASSIVYTTTIPTASPTEGTLIIYVGSEAPTTRYDRVLYIITG